MPIVNDDYGKSIFKEIGILSSMLPAYVRHCCRSQHDGTDNEVLDEYRKTAFKVLSKYREKYGFTAEHLFLLETYSPEDIKELIRKHSIPKMSICMVTSTNMGLPKRACLHCPKVGVWLSRMKKSGMADEHGKRIEKY